MPLDRLLRIGLTGDAVDPAVLAGDDDLLRAMSFLQNGQLREARALIEPFVRASERGGTQDPIDAVVAGYILLATHELGTKAEWCAELPVTDPWLPDGFVIAAEWFAAGGFHLTAARHLAQLTEVGMPLFTYGYTRALSRLRLYSFEPASTVRHDVSRDPFPVATHDPRRRRAQAVGRWDRRESNRTLDELVRRSPSVDRAALTLTVRSMKGREWSRSRWQWLTRSASYLNDVSFPSRYVAPERRLSMSSTEVQATTEAEATTEEPVPLRGYALAAALVALVLWFVFTAFMILKTGTGNEVQWTRLAYLFASVEAIAFGAAGAIWGTTINRERAEAAEKRAAANERDASNGRAMASSQIAEGGELVDEDGQSALQRMGAGPDRAAAEVLQRHARQARMLFPDL